jgi:hypothetical protein
MNTRTSLLILVLAAFFGTAVGTSTAQQSTAGTQPGRFQLAAFDIDILFHDQLTKAHRIFRIDSQTGKVWGYVNTNTADSHVEGWAEIPEEVTTTKGAR